MNNKIENQGDVDNVNLYVYLIADTGNGINGDFDDDLDISIDSFKIKKIIMTIKI